MWGHHHFHSQHLSVIFSRERYCYLRISVSLFFYCVPFFYRLRCWFWISSNYETSLHQGEESNRRNETIIRNTVEENGKQCSLLIMDMKPTFLFNGMFQIFFDPKNIYFRNSSGLPLDLSSLFIKEIITKKMLLINNSLILDKEYKTYKNKINDLLIKN